MLFPPMQERLILRNMPDLLLSALLWEKAPFLFFSFSGLQNNCPRHSQKNKTNEHLPYYFYKRQLKGASYGTKN